MKRLIAIALAAVMSLSVAGSAFAATSANVTETVTVLSTVSLALDVTSIDYGTLSPGTTSAQQPVNATISVGNSSGWTLTVTGSNGLTSGSYTIPNSARLIGSGDMQTNMGDGPLPNTISGTSSGTFKFNEWIVVPANQHAGTYAGSQTWTVTSN